MLGILILVWAAVFAPQLFAQRVFVLGDAGAFRPFSEFSRARWVEVHERTFWNPYVFAGLPATASLADSRPQYLPDAALDAIEWLRRLPLTPPLATALLAHLAGMWAAALLARALWRAGPAAMATAGVAWGLMPNLLVPMAFGHDAQFASSSLIPAALLAVHGLFAARDRRAIGWAVLATGLVLGLQGLIGHPQILAYGGVLVAGFALERAWRFRRPLRLAAAGGAAALGAALSAAVWWPALRYSAHSVRGGVPLDEVANFSHAARDLASLAWPWAVGFAGDTYWGGLRQTDYPQYLGLSVCLLALLAWPRRGERDAGTAAFFLAAAGGACLLSLGTHLGPVYRLVHEHVPLFSKFRVAVAVLVVAQVAVALLAARGLERTLERRSVPAPIVIGALAAVALGLLIWPGPLGEPYRHAVQAGRSALAGERALAVAHHAGLDLLWRGLLAGVLATALGLRAWRRGASMPAGGAALPRLAALAPIAVAALVALDLSTVSAPILARGTGRPSQLEAPEPPALARVAAAHPRLRALPLDRDAFLSNDWVSWRARSIAGEHGAASRYWSDLFSSGLLRHYPALCALSVGYLAGDGSLRVDTTLCSPVVENGATLSVLALRDAQPRAYAAPRVEAPGGDRAVLAGMFAGGFDPAAVAYADRPAAAGEYPGSEDLELRWIEDGPDRLAIETQAAQRAFLVVADAYFPGWQARVDGRRTALFRANFLVRGVAVPAGRHRVTMTYEPEGWRAGTWSTRLAMIAMAAAALVLARASRRKRGARADG